MEKRLRAFFPSYKNLDAFIRTALYVKYYIIITNRTDGIMKMTACIVWIISWNDLNRGGTYLQGRQGRGCGLRCRLDH